MKGLRAVLLLTLLLLAPQPARAQFLDDGFRSSTHAFRWLLDYLKITPLRDWQQLNLETRSTILIVLGDPIDRQGRNVLDLVPGGLSRFLQNGGAVLIATNHALKHPELTAVLGHSVEGNRAHAWLPNRPRVRQEWQLGPFPNASLYRGVAGNLPRCLIPDVTEIKDPPLFWTREQPGRPARKLRVATNGPSSLTFPGGGTAGKMLAQVPRDTFHYQEGGGNRPWILKRFTTPFAVSAQPGAGRILLMGDDGSLLNDLILFGLQERNNDNFRFAFNVVEWLQGDQRQRNRVLLVTDGTIEYDLNPPTPSTENLLKALQVALVEEGNQQVQDLQQRHRKQNLLNEVVIDGINEVSGGTLFGGKSEANFYRILALASAVALALYGLGRLLRASHRTDLGSPLFGNVVGKHSPAASALFLRQRAALAADDLRDYAREAARQWFASVAGSPETGDAKPEVQVTGSWWHRRRVRSEVIHLWELAQGEDVPRISQKQFTRLLTRLDALSEAVRLGDLHLHWQTLAGPGETK